MAVATRLVVERDWVVDPVGGVELAGGRAVLTAALGMRLSHYLRQTVHRCGQSHAS